MKHTLLHQFWQEILDILMIFLQPYSSSFCACDKVKSLIPKLLHKLISKPSCLSARIPWGEEGGNFSKPSNGKGLWTAKYKIKWASKNVLERNGELLTSLRSHSYQYQEQDFLLILHQRCWGSDICVRDNLLFPSSLMPLTILPSFFYNRNDCGVIRSGEIGRERGLWCFSLQVLTLETKAIPGIFFGRGVWWEE